MITETKDYGVRDIPSHPLKRSELEKFHENCQKPIIQLWLHPSLILPQVFIEFEDFAQVPELMVLPAQQGISVSLRCGGHLASTKAHCVPTKFNQGSLTCSLSSVVESAAASVKSKRATL